MTTGAPLHLSKLVHTVARKGAVEMIHHRSSVVLEVSIVVLYIYTSTALMYVIHVRIGTLQLAVA
jgi:hypothetical protein